MTEVTLSIAGHGGISRRFDAAFRGEPQGSHISFESADLLWRIVTHKRLAILQAMTGAGAISIRGVARKVGRDVKAVHADVTALVLAGLVERGKEGFVFPYSAVHVDFTLTRAA